MFPDSRVDSRTSGRYRTSMDVSGLPVRFLSTKRTFADGYGRAGSSRGFESHLLRFPSQSASYLDSKGSPAVFFGNVDSRTWKLLCFLTLFPIHLTDAEALCQSTRHLPRLPHLLPLHPRIGYMEYPYRTRASRGAILFFDMYRSEEGQRVACMPHSSREFQTALCSYRYAIQLFDGYPPFLHV